MGSLSDPGAAGSEKNRRLFVYNGGFLTETRVRRILTLSGFDVKLGAPGEGDAVGVWGQSPTAHRGEAVAEQRGTPVIRIEDAFLRSLHPGRAGEPTAGLLIDKRGVHFDPSVVSDLEELLATHPLDDTALLDRARAAIARMSETHLSKFAATDPVLPLPPPGYVLVIDQTRGDASVTACGADRNRFLEMLFMAREEHPGAPVVIKSHPETVEGFRQGYFEDADADDTVQFLTDPVSPHLLFEGALGVYTVSSQLGFEAIFAGHRPRVFGQPFYAGWGLTGDEFPVQRRQRRLTRAQLFAGAMMLYPKWYSPFTDALCTFEDAQENLAAQARAWREDRHGWVASAMRGWKRESLQKMFGRHKPVVFEDDPGKARATGRPWMVWASRAAVGHGDAMRTEDGFLRSRGLGANLVPPLSLIVDGPGIYYDPSEPSRLEQLITGRADLRPDQEARARALIRSLKQHRLSKYSTGGAPPPLPEGHRVLVVGQVSDDASVTAGTTDIRTNEELLRRARAERPDAVLIYKPHPDVDAGLRTGGTIPEGPADLVVSGVDPVALLNEVQEVWTMTSLLGFEALLRGLHVTTCGVPFYAGWGLTTDLGDVPPRRRATPALEGLVHAALIDYPRYMDPVTGLPCPVEVAVARLASASLPSPGLKNRLLAKLQGVFASQAHRWR
ncbi:capsular polysaccharide biosynthesis protein [Roseobacter ponti]|uniref:Capsular polysaccharide biosynthesis protein n=1 Tax=Roseobacter ponti TaxID=1891787 RepID=A0A858SRQ9_9RHOB|nr:capsular polysaccharide biosynthesis protein [Roseobacter ponti]QJF50677.1 capsular polysaccharide biosynthesis protein [Roseobacter ponti]